MKKLITVAVLVLALVANNSYAQSVDKKANKSEKQNHEARKHGKHHDGKKHKKQIGEQLNLSDAQKQQAKLIKEDYKAQMKALHKNENITVKEYRDKKAALHQAEKTKLQNLLTAEQKATAEKMKAEAAEKRKQMHAKKLTALQTKLALTDAQVAQLKTAQESTHAKMKAIKENNNLSRTDKKEQIEKLMETAKATRNNILTATQQQQLAELKKDKKPNHKKGRK